MDERPVISFQDASVQQLLAAIVESSNDAIIGKTLQGFIRTWNRGAERMFGYTAEEVIGKHVSILTVPERGDEISQILERIANGERVEHYETRRVTKDGRVLAVSLTVSPIRDASGTIIGASKIARDITEQVEARRALSDLNIRLLQSNRDLEQFAYLASHDLQEPLRMISIFSQKLGRQFAAQLGEEGRAYIDYTVGNASRMAQLLTDLRIFVQAAAASEAQDELVDTEAVLRSAIAAVAPAINSPEIVFGALPSVCVQSFLLKQLFQNLLSNAIRYHGSEPVKVHISAQRSGDMVQFSVQDNGIGIDPKYQQRIFGIFKRLHTIAEYPGTGMGLAICQRIVERSGGKIWVESELGSGATFHFTLPAGQRQVPLRAPQAEAAPN